jgi:hypothetical protein
MRDEHGRHWCPVCGKKLSRWSLDTRSLYHLRDCGAFTTEELFPVTHGESMMVIICVCGRAFEKEDGWEWHIRHEPQNHISDHMIARTLE